MRIPLLTGVTANSVADFTQSFPVNFEPRITETGIARGFLHEADGITELELEPAEEGAPLPSGADRGAILWNGVHYRVIGRYLWSIVGTVATQLGDVGDNGLPVSLDYSFTLLAIASDEKLFYWDGADLNQVTDPDLGVVLDVIWIGGYFMTTDGTSIVITELSDPYSVNPLKYGSAEDDPDPIVGLKKIRGEVYALNGNTIQNLRNVGGVGFPFADNITALIPKGCVGTHACDYILETFAFVGGGRNEAASVYLAGAGDVISISTSDVDAQLAELTPEELALVQVESRTDKNEQRLLVHLPSKTLVYSQQASQQAKQPIWHVLASGAGADETYLARHLCLVAGRWYVGDPTGRVGYLDQSVETHFGAVAGWRFDTLLIYNGGKGGIVKSLELVGLPGRGPFGSTPTCFLSWTLDGQTYSVERAISQGAPGQRLKRIQWRPKTRFRNYIGFRFRGANTAYASWTHLEGDIEGLSV